MSSDMRNTGKIYYGWYILSGALLTQFIATSTGSMVSGVLLGPVVENLGLKVWQFAFAVSVAQACGGLTVLIMGPVVDRVGPRRMMLIGSVFCTFGLTGLSMQSTFIQFFVFQLISSALGWTLFGPLVINATVTKWFVARRGWALAISSSGVSLAGLITPITMTAIVDAFGWRSGYLTLATVVSLTIIPVAMVMKRRPEDMGLLPDGIRNEDSGQASEKIMSAIISDDRQTYTRSQAIKTAGFWLITLGYGLNAAALGSVALHAIPFATSVGFARSIAAAGMGVNGLGNLSSKTLWGWGLQRFDPRRLAGIAFCTSATGVLTMVTASYIQDTRILMMGFFLYGFGFGGTIPISEFIWGRYFGRRHIASIRGLGRPMQIIFGMAGPIGTGLWFDITGSYVAAFLMLSCVYMTGALVVNISKPPKPIETDES